MKAGLHYALGVALAAAVAVLLFQQRKLSGVRLSNAQLHGSSRALHVALQSNETVTVTLQQELRKLRLENDELRRRLEQLRPPPERANGQ